MSTLNETIKDIDHKKKQLQESVDQLNEQMEVLKMEGGVLSAIGLSFDKIMYATMKEDVSILSCKSYCKRGNFHVGVILLFFALLPFAKITSTWK